MQEKEDMLAKLNEKLEKQVATSCIKLFTTIIQSLIAQKISSRHRGEELTDKLYSCENAKQMIKTELMQTKEKARQELKKKVQMSLLLYNNIIASCVCE